MELTDPATGSKTICAVKKIPAIAENGMPIADTMYMLNREVTATVGTSASISSNHNLDAASGQVNVMRLCGDHPNVVNFIGAAGDDRHVFICMECAANGDLEQLLRNESRPLRFAQRFELASRIGEALHSLHRLGIIHRDLKSENILMKTDSHPLLSDFGLGYKKPSSRGGAVREPKLKCSQ